jgi:hypothetical protein
MVTCDHCGPSVGAACEITKGELSLHLCGHCARKYKKSLIREGWKQSLDMEVFMLA